MSYYIHDLRVEGIEQLLSIKSYFITGSLGTHTTLVLTAYIETETNFLQQLRKEHAITVYLDEQTQKKILFCGVITKANILCEGNIKQVRILAKSFSYLLDIKKNSRSFQDIKMKYSTLIREVLMSYQNAHELITIADQEIGQPIIQYEETDWEFLKRVLSMLEVTITPAPDVLGIGLYIGIPELNEAVISYEVLQMEKDLASYHYLKANQQHAYDMDYVKLKIKSAEILKIFNQIFIRQQKFIVKSYYYEFSESDFIAIYELQKKAGMKQKHCYPMHLIGVAIKGIVANTKKDKVQVQLDIDSINPQTVLHWFPYSTVSASSDGSGWYCMPEIGDIVRVYFPSKDTTEAIALSAISDYQAPAGANDKMANPSIKYLSNKHNKEVVLTPEYLRINCNDKASMTIHKDGQVVFSAQNKVQLQAQEDIHISAASDIMFHAEQRVAMQCGDGGIGGLTEEGEVIFKGTEIKID